MLWPIVQTDRIIDRELFGGTVLSANTTSMDRPTPPQGRTEEERLIMQEAAKRRANATDPQVAAALNVLRGATAPRGVFGSAERVGAALGLAEPSREPAAAVLSRR